MTSRKRKRIKAAWKEHFTPNGRPYYHNSETEESTYNKPDPLKTKAEKAIKPCPWTEYTNAADCSKYWHNSDTKESVSVEPAAYTEYRKYRSEMWGNSLLSPLSTPSGGGGCGAGRGGIEGGEAGRGGGGGGGDGGGQEQDDEGIPPPMPRQPAPPPAIIESSSSSSSSSGGCGGGAGDCAVDPCGGGAVVPVVAAEGKEANPVLEQVLGPIDQAKIDELLGKIAKGITDAQAPGSQVSIARWRQLMEVQMCLKAAKAAACRSLGGGGGGKTKSLGGGRLPKKAERGPNQERLALIQRYTDEGDLSAGLAMLRLMVTIHSNHPNWEQVSSELLLSIHNYQRQYHAEESSDLDAALTWLESQLV
jgi:hypothetical protein